MGDCPGFSRWAQGILRVFQRDQNQRRCDDRGRVRGAMLLALKMEEGAMSKGRWLLEAKKARKWNFLQRLQRNMVLLAQFRLLTLDLESNTCAVVSHTVCTKFVTAPIGNQHSLRNPCDCQLILSLSIPIHIGMLFIKPSSPFLKWQRVGPSSFQHTRLSRRHLKNIGKDTSKGLSVRMLVSALPQASQSGFQYSLL